MRRSQRAADVAHAIEDSGFGWVRDPFNVPGAVADWTDRFPDVAIVADGRPCNLHRSKDHIDPTDPVCIACDNCFTDRGRGTTGFDAVRRVETSSLIRHDWLSIKTATIGKDKKLPSKVVLSTGLPSTLYGMISRYTAGVSLPTVIFASQNEKIEGQNVPKRLGRALFVDLGEAIRLHGVAGIEEYPEGGYDRGQAPACYLKWSSWRPSGAKTAEHLRRMGVLLSDEPQMHNGAMWKPGKVKYPELVISLYRLGVSRSNWTVASMGRLAEMLDNPEIGFEWQGLL